MRRWRMKKKAGVDGETAEDPRCPPMRFRPRSLLFGHCNSPSPMLLYPITKFSQRTQPQSLEAHQKSRGGRAQTTLSSIARSIYFALSRSKFPPRDRGIANGMDRGGRHTQKAIMGFLNFRRHGDGLGSTGALRLVGWMGLYRGMGRQLQEKQGSVASEAFEMFSVDGRVCLVVSSVSWVGGGVSRGFLSRVADRGVTSALGGADGGAGCLWRSPGGAGGVGRKKIIVCAFDTPYNGPPSM